MKYQKTLIFICLIICTFCIAGAYASDVNESAVANENPELISIDNQIVDDSLKEEPTGTFTDLAGEISNAGNELNLTRNYTYSAEDSDLKNGIRITKEIIINGNGFTINGNNEAEAFYIDQNNVILKNITFINCKSSADSGAVHCNRISNITISNCRFINNSATSNGGAINFKGDSNAIISDCTFIDNHADFGGAIAIGSNNATISNCNFTNNSAQDGGAVALYYNNHNIVNCYFTNNIASRQGGAIFDYSNNSTISKSVFVKNSATYYGGAIYIELNGNTVSNCSFNNNNAELGGAINLNRATNSVISNSSFKNNDANTGSAIYCFGTDNILSNCNIINNIADYGSIAVFGNANTVYNCNLINNTARVQGGGIYVFGSNTTVTRCSFKNNTAKYLGGCIYKENADILVLNYNAFFGPISRGTNDFYQCECDYNWWGENNPDLSSFQSYSSYTNWVLANLISDGFDYTVLFNQINTTEGEISDFNEGYKMPARDVIYRFKNGHVIIAPVGTTVNYEESNLIEVQIDNQIFKINKNDTYMNVSVSDVFELEEDIPVHISLPEDARGTVIISIANNYYTIILNDTVHGELDYTIRDTIGQGNHTLKIIYKGNDKYYPALFKENITVIGHYPHLNVTTFSIIRYGENITLEIELPDDARGNITITIADRNYTIILNDTLKGKFNYTLPDRIDDGRYILNVTYSGDIKYFYDKYITEIIILKNDPHFNVTSNVTFNYLENITIGIELPDDATGNIIITLNGKNYNILLNDTVYGKINYTIPDRLSGGNYTITFRYSGDENYLSSIITRNITITRIDPQLNVTSPKTVEYDEHIPIILVLPDNARGNITITLNGKNYNITLSDEESGEIYYTISDRIAGGNYTITVRYSGDNNYTESTITRNITITRFDPELDAVTPEIVFYGRNITSEITLDRTARGNITITIADRNYTIILNDTVNRRIEYTISDRIPSGVYTITFRYSGDDKFTESTVTSDITITRISPLFNVTSPATVSYGENITLEMELPDDARGNITITIADRNYTIILNDTLKGKFNWTIPDIISGGNHTITAVYSGDRNYFDYPVNRNIIIPKIDSLFNITAPDTSLTHENKTVEIKLPEDARGNITISIGDKNYIITLNDTQCGEFNWTITDAFDRGNYTIIAEYSGDGKYYAKTVTRNITILKINPELNMTAPETGFSKENIIVSIELPDDAQGNVTITIGDKNYIITLNETQHGKFNWTIPDFFDLGNYTIIAKYSGDLKYYPDEVTGNISIIKQDSKLNLTVPEAGFADENIIISIELPDNAQGNVTITIGDKNYLITLNETQHGKFNYTIPDFFDLGNYTIIAKYSGDLKYYPDEVTGNISIIKLDSKLNLTVPETGFADENITVIIELPDDAQGNVTITIGNESYLITLNETQHGKFNYTIPALFVPGNYTVNASYSGNYKYLESTESKNITLKKFDPHFNVTVPDSVRYGENITVNITLVDGARGNITISWTYGNETIELSDALYGHVEYNITGLKPDEYIINVIYSGDENYSGMDVTRTTVIPKEDYELNASLSDDNITYSESTALDINISENVTGILTVTYNNETYTFNLTEIPDNHVEISISDLAAGTYVIGIDCSGDEIYKQKSMNLTLTINKIKVNPTDINYTCFINGTVHVALPGNITGNLTVAIGDTTYNLTLVNGEAVIDLSGETPGVHSILISYSGNENYTDANITANIEIPKYDTPISIEVSDGKVGETVTVTVTVPENVEDNVTIQIDGETYSQKPVNGRATFSIDGMTAGGKTVVAVYNEDSTYKSNSTTANFTVFKNPAPISVDIDNATEGEVTVTVTLPDDVKGHVIVTVNNTEYGIDLSEGRSVVIPIRDSGDYTALVSYPGDDKYLANSTSAEFHASSKKSNPYIAAEVGDVSIGKNITVTVTVPEGGDGEVTVTIGNITNTTSVTGGENNITVSGVEEGTYNVTVDYSGNDHFKPQSLNKTVTVFRSIIAGNLTRGWNSPYDYRADFLDGSGHVLADTEVQFIINNVTYTVRTENQGTAYLNISKLDVGEYNVTVVNPVTGEKTNQTITIVPRLIENKNIKMDFADGTMYTVRVIDDDGTPVGEGEIIDIYVDTIHYVCKTDKDGYARLKINLNPGTYTVSPEYKLYKVSNRLVVKQTLKLVKKTVTVKKGKTLVLKATLKWSSGKAIKGKKIVFRFKGKSYSAKTNSKGLAKVTVKSKVTKKLKKGKKYTYSAKYITNYLKGKVRVK